MHNQRGFSLISVVFIGIALVMSLAYLRGFITIPYTDYKVASIMSSLIKEGNVKDYEIKQVFDQRVQFERIGHLVSSKDLEITPSDTKVKLKVEYEHCEALWTTWTVCSTRIIER